MVIGNGEMGRLTAEVLMEQGADVTVTVRQYRSGMVNIPKDCKRINYGDRVEFLKKCQMVVSATASPNFTIIPEMFQELPIEKEKLTSEIHQAMEKTMGKLLFELKDQISEETYRECIGAMEKIFI